MIFSLIIQTETTPHNITSMDVIIEVKNTFFLEKVTPIIIIHKGPAAASNNVAIEAGINVIEI